MVRNDYEVMIMRPFSCSFHTYPHYRSKGSPEGSVVLRIESGDRRVSAESWSKILYVAAGTDPFKLIDAGGCNVFKSHTHMDGLG